MLTESGDLKDYKISADVSMKIREIIEDKDMPPDLRRLIVSCYEELCSRRNREVSVSVRSAGIVSHWGCTRPTSISQDGPVLQMVKKVWSSIFNHRTICAAVQHELPVIESPV